MAELGSTDANGNRENKEGVRTLFKSEKNYKYLF